MDMWLVSRKASKGSSSWQSWTWPVPLIGSQPAWNIGVFASLSQLNFHNDDDTAAIAYIAGYKFKANPNKFVSNPGQPCVDFPNDVTEVTFGLSLYGNIEVTFTGGILVR
jgi:hypothetical protein